MDDKNLSGDEINRIKRSERALLYQKSAKHILNLVNWTNVLKTREGWFGGVQDVEVSKGLIRTKNPPELCNVLNYEEENILSKLYCYDGPAGRTFAKDVGKWDSIPVLDRSKDSSPANARHMV